MTTDNNRGGRGPADHATDGWATGRIGLRPAALVRSLLLAATVFTLAALTGALLSGASPAVPAEPPGTGAAGQRATAPLPGPVPAGMFAQSMIYTGSAGLAVSISGLVMVGRRRRLW